MQPILRRILPVAAAFMGSVAAEAQFTGLTDFLEALPHGSIVTNAPGSYLVQGGGGEIGGTADQFFFAYAPVVGDFDVRVKLESLDPIQRWTKGGIMLRESLSPESRMVFIRSTPRESPTITSYFFGANDIRRGYRSGILGPGSNGGEDEEGDGTPDYPNVWLRLCRAGHRVISYRSTNGINWLNQLTLDTTAWEGGALPTNLLLGLAVTSHAQGDAAQARFTGFGDTAEQAPAILRQPENVTVLLGQRATFSVGLKGFYDPKWQFQWFRNGSLIPGATESRYTAETVAEDDGSLFTVRVSNAHGATLSRGARLGLTTAPALLAASSRGNPSAVYLLFSERLDAVTAADPAKYGLEPKIAVIAAAVGSNHASVTLTTSPLTEGTTYTVRVIDVRDVGSPPQIVHPNLSRASFTHGQEFEQFRITQKLWSNIPGWQLHWLTNHPSFPNSPTTITCLPFFENTPINSADAIGVQLFGTYVAPVSGLYRFYMCSSDQGATFIAPDENPEHKFQVCFEPEFNDSRFYTGAINRNPVNPENVSSNILLQAGQRVYLEALMKHQCSFANLSVAVQLPGEPPPIAPLSATNFIVRRRLGATFFENLGPVKITSQPEDVTVTELRPAAFRVAVDGTPPYAVTWFSNNLPIARANDLTLLLSPGVVSEAANGALFHAVIQNEFSVAISRVARLNVQRDMNPPVLLSVIADQSAATVTLTFSEAIREQDATNQSNFSVVDSTGRPVPVTQALLRGGTNITLTLLPPAEGSEFEVSARNLRDTSASANILAPVTRSFSSWIFSRGFGLWEIYYGIFGVAVADLTSHPKYPDTPDQTDYLTHFEWPRRPTVSDEPDSVGERISGYLLPPVTGKYHFYISSDDQSEFWLSTDERRANLRKVASEPEWNDFRNWTGIERRNPIAPENRSTTLFPEGIFLVGGQRYYFEALLKEGPFKEYLGVAWQKPGDSVPARGSPPIPGAFMGIYFNPDAAAQLEIREHPTNQDKLESEAATFDIVVTNSLGHPQFFQWLSNGVEILDAHGPSYTTPPLRRKNHGDRFSCRISVPGQSIISTQARLSVRKDKDPPTLVSAGGVVGNRIGLCFSELIEISSLLDPANYAVFPAAAVTNILIRPDGKSVLLELENKIEGAFTATVQGVADLVGNVIEPSVHPGNPLFLRSEDVGQPKPAGTAWTCDGSGFEVTAGGLDIWGTHDEFHFVYSLRTNNFDIAVKVEHLSAANTWSKAGLMARETLRPGSRHLTVVTDPSPPAAGVLEAIRRPVLDGETGAWFTTFGVLSPLPNAWLRLKRVGSSFSGYWGVNGRDWFPFAFAIQNMPENLFVGLATSAQSEDTNRITSATFRAFADFSYPNASVVITTEPADAFVQAGQRASFSAAGQVNGAPQHELSFQWQRDGINIPGANQATYMTRADASNCSADVINKHDPSRR